jgi:hypothetical protein
MVGIRRSRTRREDAACLARAPGLAQSVNDVVKNLSQHLEAMLEERAEEGSRKVDREVFDA